VQLHRTRALVARSLLFFGFWLLLLEPDPLAPAQVGVDWLVGASAAFSAALVSLRLLQPAAAGLRLRPLLHFLLRFLRQSLMAGLDVARRALDPRLPLDPGMLRQPTALHGATSRTLFAALTSQVPGTLAVDLDDRARLLYHCLDQTQNPGPGLATDEALFLEVLGGADGTGRGRG
jgi:multicomponent Na+:H+ antiporter subunit E